MTAHVTAWPDVALTALYLGAMCVALWLFLRYMPKPGPSDTTLKFPPIAPQPMWTSTTRVYGNTLPPDAPESIHYSPAAPPRETPNDE